MKLNTNSTKRAAQDRGYNARRTVNKAAKTTKTAAQVGVAAVSGFLTGFFKCQAPAKR